MLKNQKTESVNNKDGVSVIISAYCASQYIEECLNSIAVQSYFHESDEYEILVGVDGCIDTLAEILKIRDNFKKLKIVWFPKNSGPYLAFNTLIYLSNFSKISIFGADDIMKINFINENLKLLKERSCVFSRGQNFISPDKDKIIREYNPHGVILFHKEDLFKVNGFEPWRCGADSDLKNRFILDGIKIILSKNPTFLRRLHSNSLTSTKGKYGFGSDYRRKIQKIGRSRTEPKLKEYKIHTKYEIQ